MPGKTDKPKKYSTKYFLKTLPSTHNPLIGMLRDDTLCNVRNALCALREITETPDFGMTEHAIDGYHLLMTGIVDAINFELYKRK